MPAQVVRQIGAPELDHSSTPMYRWIVRLNGCRSGIWGWVNADSEKEAMLAVRGARVKYGKRTLTLDRTSLRPILRLVP